MAESRDRERSMAGYGEIFSHRLQYAFHRDDMQAEGYGAYLDQVEDVT